MKSAARSISASNHLPIIDRGLRSNTLPAVNMSSTGMPLFHAIYPIFSRLSKVAWSQPGILGYHGYPPSRRRGNLTPPGNKNIRLGTGGNSCGNSISCGVVLRTHHRYILAEEANNRTGHCTALAGHCFLLTAELSENNFARIARGRGSQGGFRL